MSKSLRSRGATARGELMRWLGADRDPAGSFIAVQTDSLGRAVSFSGDTPTQHFLY